MGLLISVWGASGCGKTSLAVKLAQYLAEEDISVLLLLADRVTPPLPQLAPGRRFTNKRSLGSVFAANTPNAPLLRFHTMGVEDVPSLSVLAMLKGENACSYPEPHQEQASALLAILPELAELVLVDCGAALPWDTLSLTAIRQADLSLCLLNPDLKTVSFLSSQLPLTEAAAKDGQRRLRVLNHVTETDVAAEVFNDADIELPWCRELTEQSALGELLDPLRSKAGRRYLQCLSALTEQIFL